MNPLASNSKPTKLFIKLHNDKLANYRESHSFPQNFVFIPQALKNSTFILRFSSDLYFRKKVMSTEISIKNFKNYSHFLLRFEFFQTFRTIFALGITLTSPYITRKLPNEASYKIFQFSPFLDGFQFSNNLLGIFEPKFDAFPE